MGAPGAAPYGYPPQMPPPAPAKKENFLMKGFMPKLWVLLIFIGLLLVGVGSFVAYAGAQPLDQCQNNAISNSNLCTDPQDLHDGWNNNNDSVTSALLTGVGFIIAAIGVLFVGLMLASSVGPKKEEPVQPMSAAPAGYPGAAPAAAPAWAPASTPPAYQAPAAAAPVAAAPVAAAAPAGGAGPACKTCGKPTTWIAQYSRYYCQGCAQYV